MRVRKRAYYYIPAEWQSVPLALTLENLLARFRRESEMAFGQMIEPDELECEPNLGWDFVVRGIIGIVTLSGECETYRYWEKPGDLITDWTTQQDADS